MSAQDGFIRVMIALIFSIGLACDSDFFRWTAVIFFTLDILYVLAMATNGKLE